MTEQAPLRLNADRRSPWGLCGAFVLLALGSACTSAPKAGEEGSVEDLGEMIVRRGAQPVLGTESETPVDPDSLEEDPYALPDLDTAAALQEALEAEPRGPELPEPAELSPYIRFGERILVKTDGEGTQFITKPYTMPVGKAAKLIELITAMEPFAFVPRPAPEPETGVAAALVPGVVQYQVLGSWDSEYYGNLAAEVPAASGPVELSDVIIVTATGNMLAEFEYFLDTFSAGVPQIELEAKIIEIVDTNTTDIGIRGVDEDTPIFGFGDSNFIKSLGYNFGNASDPFEALLTLGAVQDQVAFNAVLEVVQTWQNVSIDSRPKTVVRAGGIAQLESALEIPFFNVGSITPNGGFNATIDYKRVGVKLYICPRVVGSKMLALEVRLEGSQAVGLQRTVSTAEDSSSGIDVPIIAYRTARTVVYLEPGQTLVIGGLTQERSQDVVSKIPLLGDIPLLGHLFRSTFKQIEKEHVIFAISPRIIQRSEFQPEL